MDKKTKVFVLVNTLQSVSSFIYSNHINFFAWTAKHMPEVEFVLFTPHRMSIDRARNEAASLAMNYECDYLLFLDDDVLVPPNALKLLMDSNKDVCAGLVIIRGMPFNVMAFEFVPGKDGAPQLTNLNRLPLEKECEEGHSNYDFKCDACEKVSLVELVRCSAVGFSLALIKVDVIQPLDPPYFITGPMNTEDIYFCMKLRNLEPTPDIFMNTRVQCGHLLNPEAVEFLTRKRLYKLYEEEHLRANTPTKRDEEYIKHCLIALK